VLSCSAPPAGWRRGPQPRAHDFSAYFVLRRGNASSLNPQPQTINPTPYTLHPKPCFVLNHGNAWQRVSPRFSSFFSSFSPIM
jgi:hypothetical protein